MLTKKLRILLNISAISLMLCVPLFYLFNTKDRHLQPQYDNLSRPRYAECGRGIVYRVITNYANMSFVEVESRVFAGTNVVDHTIRDMWMGGVLATNGMRVRILTFDYDFKLNLPLRDGLYGSGLSTVLAVPAE